ncbi:hypothetical protein H2198_004686 [Neophaeococcomyces mojaviensis]|uniref:Uncharacterized protein n=1 Tax=Neophaeococcomyces mojaviensis TaxID=3383035 RepID=A0ACC3A7S0_9EURO|nr:hypothetical protein H2198_004686 [Knufia sp. JES_112]
MKGGLALLALIGAALAKPMPQGVTSSLAPSASAPAGCQASAPGPFQITVVNVTTSSSKRGIENRQADGTLTLTLQGGILKDQAGRFGYIAANRQFQFDNPIQAGAIFTAGWSVCSNGSLALGGSAIFYQCLSGNFYNLYDQTQGGQCGAIYIVSLGGSGAAPSSSAPASVATDGQPQVTTVNSVTQLTDGQPQATTKVSQISDGQVQATTATAKVSQISDGQVQATTGRPVSQISDGQVQATTATAKVSQISDGQVQATTGRPVSQISDGQVQATTATAKVSQISDGQVQATTGRPVSQISDGQVQATTATARVSQISDGQVQATTGRPVSQISDGQVQATTGQPVTQISDGQVQATTGRPVSQITDGQIQAPTSTAAVSPARYTGAANRELGGSFAFMAGIVGAIAML